MRGVLDGARIDMSQLMSQMANEVLSRGSEKIDRWIPTRPGRRIRQTVKNLETVQTVE